MVVSRQPKTLSNVFALTILNEMLTAQDCGESSNERQRHSEHGTVLSSLARSCCTCSSVRCYLLYRQPSLHAMLNATFLHAVHFYVDVTLVAAGITPRGTKSKRVIAERGQKVVGAKRSNSRENTTVVATINAAGIAIPPLIIFKGQRVQPAWLGAGGPPSSKGPCSSRTSKISIDTPWRTGWQMAILTFSCSMATQPT